MRKLISNTRYVPISFNRMSDGSLNNIGVDQFPCNVENRNNSGFPLNDVSLLLQVSKKVGLNSSLFESVANRLRVIQDSNPSKYKTLDDAFNDWTPATIQTPAERLEFAEYLHIKFDKSDVPTDEVETNSYAKPEVSAVSDSDSSNT